MNVEQIVWEGACDIYSCESHWTLSKLLNISITLMASRSSGKAKAQILQFCLFVVAVCGLVMTMYMILHLGASHHDPEFKAVDRFRDNKDFVKAVDR